ncbi:MAG: alpha/beta hydrolase [Pseudomonadota bacterium]
MTGTIQIHKSYAASLHMRRMEPAKADSAPSLVFLHGNSFDGGIFENLMLHPALADRDLVAFDLPGHGESACLPQSQSYNFGSMADRVGEALEDAEISNALLVGWSLGGHVALEALDRVPGVSGALVCGMPIMPNNPIASLFAMHFTAAMLLASKRNFTHTDAVRFERLALGARANGTHVPAMLRADGRARSEIAQSVLRGTNRDQRNLAIEAGRRLCIINSINDPLIRSDYVARFAEQTGFSGMVKKMDGTGHAPFLDKPEAFLSVIDQFEASLAQGADQLAKAA